MYVCMYISGTYIYMYSPTIYIYICYMIYICIYIYIAYVYPYIADAICMYIWLSQRAYMYSRLV